MKLVNGQAAVVTGAASGIGFALAEAFGKRGLSVMLADVEESALEAARQRLSQAGYTVAAHRTDVSDHASVQGLAAATVDRFGHVDLLVNNAGVGGALGPIWASDPKDWAWTLGVNLFGVVNGLQTILPAMVARRQGHVVNVASLAGLTSVPFTSTYGVSKHAVVALSESLAGELAAVGSPIKVSVVCPGLVQTRIFESERNRPAELKAVPKIAPETLARIRSGFAERMGTPMPASELADRVIAGIERDDFLILTHPQYNPDLLARLERMRSSIQQVQAELAL
jgi:NAD(P)-dependent dehydrogenase (short-subunit alcohol dehydrogenase family)